MAVTTIIMPVSRDTHLSRIFPRLEMLECKSLDTNLFCYVDGDYQLYQKTRNWVVNSKFNQNLCVWRSKGSPSVGSVRRRRQRIADIHNELKVELNKADFVLLLEDDGIFPTNTLKKLLKNYEEHPHAGFITGVELGRWGYKHLGLWEFDDIYEPNKITTPLLKEGTHQIDAAGIYCTLTRFDTYMKHYFKPYEDILGPDVDFGIELRKIGFQNYADYSIKLTHLTNTEEIRFLDSEIVQVQFTRNDNSQFGWNMTTL